MSDRRGVIIPILLFLSHWSFESRHFSSFVCVIFFHINFCCDQPQARLVASKFSRLFWGEQPPFTPIGRGGRYFFGEKKKTSNSERIREQAAELSTLNFDGGKNLLARRIGTGCVDSRRRGRLRLLARGNMARAHDRSGN